MGGSISRTNNTKRQKNSEVSVFHENRDPIPQELMDIAKILANIVVNEYFAEITSTDEHH